VRKAIQQQGHPDFDTFFSDYVMSVQDANLEYEMKYMVHMNHLEILDMPRLIETTYKAVIGNDKDEQLSDCV
jgi:hypothetical protein